MDVVLADWLQFAFTVMFHYLFPIGTMGIAPFIAWSAVRAARADDERASRAARFRTRIFAVHLERASRVRCRACFAFSSALLVLLFGVALGNLVRGLPLSASGYFVGIFAAAQSVRTRRRSVRGRGARAAA
ncbi:MAG: cytochrome ubiquinol oxidase subunit I [Vulcanimicrobiaceae bacterium]